MSRWLMLGLTILGVILIFTTRNPGILMLGLLCGVVGFFGFILALAADRVSASSRPETSMVAIDDLASMRKPHVRPPARPVAAAPVPIAKSSVVPTRPGVVPRPASANGEMRMPDTSD